MLYINIDNVFAMVRGKAIQETPVIENSTDNGSPVFSESFAKKVFKAYIPAAFSLGLPYTRYSPSENTTAWSTPYFAKIRHFIPDMESIFATQGRGYKYRDVIWMLLCALNQCAQIRTSSDATASVMQDAYKLWNCAQIESSASMVFIGTADEITAKQRSIQDELSRQQQNQVTPSAPIPGEPERLVAPEAVLPAAAVPESRSNTGLLVAAAALVAGFFLIK